MSVSALYQLIEAYVAADEREMMALARLRSFLSSRHAVQAVFSDDVVGTGAYSGHITVSAWIINSGGSRVVLMHHGKTGRWEPPGGHCGGNPDVHAVALYHAYEETGLGLSVDGCGLFGLEVQDIAAYWNTPEHVHYELCFLFYADDQFVPIQSSRSRVTCWVGLDDVEALERDAFLVSLIGKTRRLASQCS